MHTEHIILQALSKAITNITKKKDGIFISCRPNHLTFLLNFLKLTSLLKYNTLLDQWACDKLYPEKERFELYYMLLSQSKLNRIFIKINIGMKKNLAKSYSISEIYPTALFLEREIWDLFGIFFSKHTDLRRIMTDYGFTGFPLRKDFPVTGFREIRYDDLKEELVYEKVKFVQAYRLYTHENPWSTKKKSSQK